MAKMVGEMGGGDFGRVKVSNPVIVVTVVSKTCISIGIIRVHSTKLLGSDWMR